MTMLVKTNSQSTDFIKFISFNEVELWDVKRYYSERIKSKYPIVKLGLHIKEESHRVKLSNFPEKTFGILGVSNKIGIFDAYDEKGENINQSYKKMEVGWIAYNPYRINVGSIGLRTTEQKNNFISPAYVVFSCQETLIPDFLFKLFKTERFNKIIKENTTGSVRQNLTFDILQTMNIPLPPLNVQIKLLKAYYLKTKEAEQQEKEVLDKEKEISEYLLNKTNIKLVPVVKNKGLSFIQFNSIDRWAADYLLNLMSIGGIHKSNYPIQKVRSLLLSYQYGISEKATEEQIGTPMLRMNNINNSELLTDDLKYITLTDEQKDKVLLNKGDLLFNRTNSKELVGKTAVFDVSGEYCYASYLICLKFDSSKVNVHYMNYLFNSPIGRIQIDMVSRQVLGQANVNAQELQDFIFPIPDLKTQNLIVNDIFAIKAGANKLKELADLNRRQAIGELENDIFNL